MKKKLLRNALALLCALTCAFTLVACFEDGGTSGNGSGNARPTTPSENLLFSLNDDGQSYAATGLGTCTDAVVVIPSQNEGKPVTKVESHFIGSEGAFVTQVYIPDTVTQVRISAFSNKVIKTFSSVDGESGREIEYVDRWIIRAGSKLELVTTLSHSDLYAEGIVGIADMAFSSCYKLISAKLPDTVKHIGFRAFANKQQLNFIELPAGLVSIADQAFSDSRKSAYLVFNGTTAQWKAVKKGEDWNGGIDRIKCTDGVLDAKGNVKED